MTNMTKEQAQILLKATTTVNKLQKQIEDLDLKDNKEHDLQTALDGLRQFSMFVDEYRTR